MCGIAGCADDRSAATGLHDLAIGLTERLQHRGPDDRGVMVEPDVGLLFHLGVNGQILMHFAALHQIPWADYLQRMRDGIDEHGPVREGVYAMTGYEGVEAHNETLGQASSVADTGTGSPNAGSPNAAAPIEGEA